jgi:cyclophilin family peptidyl-prolyl cis-trans isomerase
VGAIPDPARSRAVLIGTSQYTDEHLRDVPAVTHTLVALEAVLTDPRYGVIHRDQCRIVVDVDQTSQVGDALHAAADEAEELLLVYFTGHGLLAEPSLDLYLALRGSRPDKPQFGALSFDEVRQAIEGSRAKSKIVILDCCFSGRVISGVLADEQSVIRAQTEVTGAYVLTSAPRDRVALVLPGEEHTAFTGRLVHLLREGIGDGQEVITIDEAYLRLLETFRGMPGMPTPQRRATGTAHLTPIARNRAYRPAVTMSVAVEIWRRIRTLPWPLDVLMAATRKLVDQVREGFQAPTPWSRARLVLREAPPTVALAVLWPVALFLSVLYVALLHFRERNRRAFGWLVGGSGALALLVLGSLVFGPSPSPAPTSCGYTQTVSDTASRTFSVPLSIAKVTYGAVFHTTAGDFTVSSLSAQSPCAAYAMRFLIQDGFYNGQQCSYFDQTTSGYVLDCYDPASPPSNDGLEFAPDNSSLPSQSDGLVLMSVASGTAAGILAFSGNNPAPTPGAYEACAQVIKGISVLSGTASAGYHEGALDIHAFANKPFTIISVSLPVLSVTAATRSADAKSSH